MRSHSFSSLLFLSLLFSFTILSCRTNDSSEQTATQSIKMVPAPTFNADSAYAFVARQVEFGPQVPDDSTRKTLPVTGANDGGSSVGILLEVARTLYEDPEQT